MTRVDILGVGVSCITLDDAVEYIGRWIDHGDRQYVCVTGMHGVMESRRDEELRAIHNHSGLTTPDGMPLVWAGRRAGAPRIDRVYGPDLMWAVSARAVQQGWKVHLLGGRPGVADACAAALVRRFPSLQITGTTCPPFRTLSDEEEDRLVDELNDSGADIIWVALGTPKQERWMADHRSRLSAAVLVGVGAAFDMLAGTAAQAPRWIQRSGLEWAFRLAHEPRRLWRRYLVNIPLFAAGLLREPPRLYDWIDPEAGP